MPRTEKAALYKYKDKRGEERVGFIDPKKASKVESFKKHAKRKRKENSTQEVS